MVACIGALNALTTPRPVATDLFNGVPAAVARLGAYDITRVTGTLMTFLGTPMPFHATA